MTTCSTGFFRAEGDLLVPLARATSGWGRPDRDGQLRGTAVSGALALAAERTAGGLDGADRFRPVRWTLDLFRLGAMVPSTTRVMVVRGGRRLRLIDVALVQGDTAVARATLLLLATGGPSVGTTWTGSRTARPHHRPASPPTPPSRPSTAATPAGRPMPEPTPTTAARRSVWFPAVPVEGEDPTPFEHVAVVADAANLATSWGTHGVEFINADPTLTLTRLPAADEGVGLVATSRVEADGAATGTTTVFDRHGPLGSVVATLANGDQAVDPAGSR